MGFVDLVRRYARLATLAVGIVWICAWQIGFRAPEAKIDERYKVTASTGINREMDFVFYLHHLNLFPVATNAKILADTPEEARRLLREAPDQLKQDQDATFRSGDRGRTYLYLLDVWLHHSTLKPSVKPAHALAFTFALCALFFSFWSVRKPVYGAVLCVLLGSNPWQLYAVYKQENVFSWPIVAMVLLLAINIPVMLPKRRPWYPLAAAIASGLVMALIRTVRSEPLPMLLAAMLMAATAQGLSTKLRARNLAVVVVAFAIGSWGSLKYLDHKLRQSMVVVADAGGSPYAAPIVAYHEFWHPVWCGLGDFDKKYGYEWNDRLAYKSVYPVLKKLHPELDLNPNSPYQSWFYDGDKKKYPFFFGETPGYHDAIRDKVLGDIKRDPRWFIDIIKQRIVRVFTETTPVAVAFQDSHYELGGSLLAISCLPLAIFLLLARRWFLLKLLVFSVPLSVPALMIYSGGGMTWYTMFHIFGAFIFGVLAVEGARNMYRRRYSRANDI